MRFQIRNNLIAMGALAAFLVTPTVEAGVTLLTDPSQMTTSFINTFDPPDQVINTAWASFSGGNVYILDSGAASGGITSSGNYGLVNEAALPDTLTATLGSAYTAVGMYFGNDDPQYPDLFTNFNATLSAYAGSLLLGSVSVAANMNDWADQFIGLASTDAFDKVTLTYGDTYLYIFIDDFRVGDPGTSNVPEPASLALLGLGLTGLALSRRRK